MSAAPAGTASQDPGHLRGIRVVEVDRARVVRFILVAVLVILVASTIVLAVSAATHNARLDRLRHQGVPVQVTVTGCSGVSSGIGMAIEYWECRGTYSLAGHSYNQMIGGSRALLQPGQQLPAVAVPGHPALLSTVAAANKSSAWSAYLTPIVLGALALALAAALVVGSKRRRSREKHETAGSASGSLAGGP
jgi:hypothetical protein